MFCSFFVFVFRLLRESELCISLGNGAFAAMTALLTSNNTTHSDIIISSSECVRCTNECCFSQHTSDMRLAVQTQIDVATRGIVKDGIRSLFYRWNSVILPIVCRNRNW